MKQASDETSAEIRVPAPRGAAPEEKGPDDLRHVLVSTSSTKELRRRLAAGR